MVLCKDNLEYDSAIRNLKNGRTFLPADKKGSSIMNAAYLTPAITLFHEDGSLDFESQEHLFNNLIENGVDGI